VTGSVLVTGGAGFVGSTLVDRLLAAGHSVDVVDDLSTGSLSNLADARSDRGNDFRFHHHDVSDASVVDLITHRRPEVVFHLAARPDSGSRTARPDLDARVDVVGALHVIEGARAAGCDKVVYASSASALYGRPRAGSLPLRESAPHRPRTPHGLATRVVTEYLGLYREVHELEFTALLLGVVYGPRQGPDGEAGVVLGLARELLAGGAGTVPADGRQTRDLVYVDDVVDALVRAADRGGGLLCNIGSGVETSMLDLHRVMADAVGSDAAARLGGEAFEGPARFCLDPGRAAIHLGWKPWTPLEEGVAEVLRWVQSGRRRG
jgi:UDP-glucose 4-epimerase